ncbi:MAG: hypothetical protein Q9167_006412 [Letrouitia subvulpina]
MNSPCPTDLSSELSSVGSLSPPPPSDYPSPQSSQDLCPAPTDSEHTSRKHSEEPDEQPAVKKKKRRAEPKPRTTEYLDLKSSPCSLDLEQAKQLDLLLKVLRKRNKIVVIAGAGISVSAGIPDFRSATGLFSSLRSEHKLKASGKHLFDASVYQTDLSTSHFHDMVRSLSHLVSHAKPTVFHHMLATLAKEDRLLRLYTQNVDGIDTSLPPLKTEVPLGSKGPWPRTIQLHGGLQKMICSKCKNLSDFEPALFDGPVAPLCALCIETDKVRTNHAGKRSHGVGRLRPNMVLYNEHNPEDETIGYVVKADLRARPDAVIVVGTSMKIPGVRRIVREMCGVVRGRRDGLSVWINHGPPPAGKEFEDCWDLVVRGSSDEVANQAKMRQWDDNSKDFEECTESDTNRAKEESEVKVLIQSPQKEQFAPHMPTPAPSPGPNPHRPPIPKLNFGKLKHVLVKPTSSLLASAKIRGSNDKAKSRPKSQGSKKTGKNSTTSTATAKITKSYKIIKPCSSHGKKKKKSPAPSKSEEQLHSAMAPLSPLEARNNGPLPSLSMLLFPNLNTDKPGEENAAKDTESPRSKTVDVVLQAPPVSLQKSCNEIISPTGSIPSGMEHLLH